MRSIHASLFFLALLTSTALASTYYVPDDFSSIQAAINSSLVVNGDTVIVRSGTYVENIDFLGKAITLKSESGPNATIIDGKNGTYPYQSVVTFENGEGRDSVLDGFTITNGKGNNILIYYYRGGGICCLGASPTIRNNIVCHNSVQVAPGGYSTGGGIFCDEAALIENNVIHHNSADGNASGGGIFCMIRCVVAGNIIHDNSTTYHGGGIICSDACRIHQNTIYNNYAEEGGGGIDCRIGSPLVTNNLVFDNTGGTLDRGGGIACGGFSILEGNILYGNTDCGISCWGLGTLNNNTVTANNGPGIWVSQQYTNPKIKNTIIWNNSGPEIELAGPGAKPEVTFCDVEGGWPGTSNIDADPLFTDPGKNDFHLTWLSPCINRGDNTGVVTLEDIEGDPRPYMGTVDMGADEFGGLHALGADTFSISEAAGGYVDLYLFGGGPGGGRYYMVIGSVSGTAPGTILPGGKATLPLNWDVFTNIMLGLLNTPVFQSFTGQLTWGSSTGWARFDTLGPVPGTAGLTLSFAFALMNPWDFVSNPINIEIVP